MSQITVCEGEKAKLLNYVGRVVALKTKAVSQIRERFAFAQVRPKNRIKAANEGERDRVGFYKAINKAPRRIPTDVSIKTAYRGERCVI